MIHHDVDRVLEFVNFALGIDCNLLREVAFGDSGGHFGDVTHLSGKVSCKAVHVISQVFPYSGGAFHVGLTAELPLSTHFFHDAGHF